MKPVKQLATIIQRVESLHQRYLYDVIWYFLSWLWRYNSCCSCAL